MSHIRFDGCMETRLVWMAEDPSTDPMSAWGHMGSQRSDGVPSRGCDGNLAGGSGNTGATVAQKWWNSLSHRLSLYKPSNTGSTAGRLHLLRDDPRRRPERVARVHQGGRALGRLLAGGC